MWDKLILKEKDYEILTKGIASGIGIGILIGAIAGEVILLFSLGGDYWNNNIKYMYYFQ